MKRYSNILCIIIIAIFCDYMVADSVCDESECFTLALCEGNFGADNSSLWYFDNNDNVLESENNPIGDTGQSMLIDNDKLYVIMNGSGLIHVFNLNPSGIQFNRTINLDFSGPRYMEIYNGNAFITEWNTNQIRVLNLENDQTIHTIAVDGMPEQLIFYDNFFYVSINMNSDWSAAEKVLKINPTTYDIEAEYTTAPNPGDMEVIQNQIYVSSTFYDSDWNTFHATTKINLIDGSSTIFEYNSDINFMSDIVNVHENLYRATNFGVVQLDLGDLNVISGTEIGNYSDVHSVEFLNNHFYFGRTDYVAPDDVEVLDTEGNFVNSFPVGAIPGSFVFWNNHFQEELSVIINEKPKSYKFNKIYPNPFNPVTNISYALPLESKIIISIFDVNGRKITTLTDGIMTAGIHTVKWNAEGYPGGVYFVKLDAGEFSQTQKLMLIK